MCVQMILNMISCKVSFYVKIQKGIAKIGIEAVDKSKFHFHTLVHLYVYDLQAFSFY